MDERRQDDPVNARAEESPSLPADHQPIEVDGLPIDMRADMSEKDNPESPSLPKAEPESHTAHKRTTVKVEYKHSLATRWMHWINCSQSVQPLSARAYRPAVCWPLKAMTTAPRSRKGISLF
jgi:hypothetical protein